MTEDLDSGYWHLGVKHEHQTFLGIHIYSEEGELQFFVWRVMFLGVSDAVFIFSAILKPIRSYLNLIAIRNALYIDDLLVLGDSRQECIENDAIAKNVLAKAGWVVSLTKTKGPATRIKYLGLEVCTITKKFFIPDYKIESIKNKISFLLSVKKVYARTFASLIGLLQSCYKALGPIVRLKTRSLYLILAKYVSKFGWDGYVKFSDEASEELNFWQLNIDLLNGYHFDNSLTVKTFHSEIVSDASQTGYLVYESGKDYKVLSRQMFSVKQSKLSSTFRELFAVHSVFGNEISAANYSNQNISYFVDNFSVTTIMLVGSRNPKLQSMVLDIYNVCKKFNINLSVNWCSRDHYKIQHADMGSRAFDNNNISLNFESFGCVTEFFQEFQFHVDTFADFWNKKSQIYFSKIRDESSSGVNFFAQELNPNVHYYCFPPPSVIPAAIKHFSKFKSLALIVFPCWTAASFWSSLFPDGKHLPPWAVKFVKFRPSGFVKPDWVSSSTFNNPPRFDMGFVLCDFSNSEFDNYRLSIKIPSLCFDYGCSKCV